MTADKPPRGPTPRPGPTGGRRTVLLKPDSVRQSQTTITSPTQLFRIRLSLQELVAIYKHSNYMGDPISVVPMPDGRLTSLDNRRLWAARRAGLERIPAIIHDPDEPWGNRAQRDSLRRDTPLIDIAGELGPPGRVLMKANAQPTTHLLAVLRRCGNQTSLTGSESRCVGSTAIRSSPRRNRSRGHS